MSLPDKFSTLQPSLQYSSICASVSADPRASLPCALQASRDPAHGGLERRVLELEMDAEAQVRMAISDHVDALDGGDRLDIFQALERFDRHADDDVGVGLGRILGGMTGAMAPVPGVHPRACDAAMTDRRIFCLHHDRARASSTLSTSETWMPMIPWSRIAGIRCVKDLWIRTIAETSVAWNQPARSAIVSRSKAPCSWSIMQ